MSIRTQAIIDTQAIKTNLKKIREIAPNSKILAMVKSNAYGHGLVSMGKLLQGVDGFGVACMDEAIRLRESGINQTIVLMSGINSPADLELVEAYQLDIVFHDFYQIKILQAYNIKKPLSAWLKLDTGMHRLGFTPGQFDQAYELLVASQKVKLPLTLMTHLADADDQEKGTTQSQLAVFKEKVSALDCPKSIANSAGILGWPDAIAHWNRPGIMLYGISPIRDRSGLDYGLLPVMTLTSRIIAFHDLNEGDAVGYGGTWRCPAPMRIAVVAIGYGDGYPWQARNGTPTLIRGKICPLAGRVSMDLITVDVTGCMQAQLGDDVTLWGSGLAAEHVAKYANTIAYELVCNVSQRVVFVYR